MEQASGGDGYDSERADFRGDERASWVVLAAQNQKAAKVQAGGQEAAKAKFGAPVIVKPLDWG
jgi:uncharacterized protein YciI